MKFKEFLKNLFVNVKDGISRFLVAFICSSLGFLTAAFEIISDTNEHEIIYSLLMTFGFVAVLSVLMKVIQEYMDKETKPLIQYIICAASGILAFILIKTNYESLYTAMAYSGIIIALLCFIFFVIMRDINKDTAFPRLVSSWFFTIAVCAILSSGLSTCIAAFDQLIFSWDDSYKIYSIVNLFVWIVVFVNLFLSFIPKKEGDAQQSKIFRIFVLFAGLPLYILLIAILLLYLAKIVITWHMPVGEINWFASFASLFFIFFLMSVMQYPEKLAKMFVKYGGYFLIPVLIMQSIAVFERINAYGITTPRTVSITLIIISMLFIAGGIIIPKHLNKIALASGIIVLIVTITPFNVIDLPIKSQTNILETTLMANDMIKDGKVVPNSNISREDADKIISSFEYLKYNAKKVPDYITDKDKTTEEIFGVKKSHENEYIHCKYKTKSSVDISEYTTFLRVEEKNDIIEFTHNQQQYQIDLKEIGNEFYSTHGEENNELDIYVIDKGVGLYFDHFSFSFTSIDNPWCSFDGYLLLK